MHKARPNVVLARALIAASAFCLVGAPFAFAQAAPAQDQTTHPAAAQPAGNPAPAADTAAPGADQQQIVLLDPFTVTTENEGYQAVDTLGGSRTRTKLVDLPSSLSVITKQFLEDTGITNAQQLLAYTTNTEIGGIYGNYSGGISQKGMGVPTGNVAAETGRLDNPSGANRARGLSPMDNTRNYFLSQIPWDSYDISRVDMSRGPNSFLYGVGSPSGIINASTNDAVYKDEGNIEAKVGSFGTTRESLDFNKVILPQQLTARIDLLNDDTQFEQKPAYSHDERFYGALRFDPKQLATDSSHMTISGNYEAGKISSNNPRELPPVDRITGYFSGMNKSGYDPSYMYQTLSGSPLPIGSFINPWIVTNQGVNAITFGATGAPIYMYNGATGRFLTARADNAGMIGSSNGNNAFLYQKWLSVGGFADYAYASNAFNKNLFPGETAGTVTYQDKTLADPSIYNFYKQLIDGPNKHEWQRWNAYDVNVEESLLHDQLVLQFTVDHQDLTRGQQGLLLGENPFISVDINSNWGAVNQGAPTDPYEGMPFVGGASVYGNNSAHFISDNYQLELTGYLRADDFLAKSPLTDFLGQHQFTAVLGDYLTKEEDRQWEEYAATVDYATATGGTSTNQLLTGARQVGWIAYLGPSLASRSSASGANLSNIQYPIIPGNTNVSVFNWTWNNTSVKPTDAYANPLAGGNTNQAANPANYVGWNPYYTKILDANNGSDLNQLYTAGTKKKNTLRSGAFEYQGSLWDDTIIPEVGWRRDSDNLNGANTATTNSIDSATGVAYVNNYGIFGNGTSLTTTSTSWGLTLHTPKALRKNLPWDTDVSLYYFHGNNQTPQVRYGFDGSALPSESGKTDDFGIGIDTLNHRASLRVTFYKTKDLNANLSGSAANPLGSNAYYLYLLEAWGTGSAITDALGLQGKAPNEPWYWNWAWVDHGYDNTYYNMDPTSSTFQNDASTVKEKAAIASWQAQMQPQAFFDAYGMPINVAAVKAGNWTQGVGNGWTVDTGIGPIQPAGGGQINGQSPTGTQDITAKGVEIEGTVRPIPNLDITFNASKLTAYQTALGSQLSSFIVAQYNKFQSPAGDLRLWWAGDNTLRTYYVSNIWSAYQLQLQETGASQPEIRPWNFKVIANYNFQNSWMKGINIGGGVRWADKPILGYGVKTYVDPTGATQYAFDVNKPYYGHVDMHLDAWIGYQHRLTDKIDWRIQLNAYNVGESDHLEPISLEPDGSTAASRIVQGTTWEFSNKFMF